MIAPTMPAETGNGLAMRLGLFLEALTETADVDLRVLPIAGRTSDPSPIVGCRSVECIVLTCDKPDTHFSLLTRLKDPAARLEAFARYGRPTLSAYLSAAVLRQLHASTAGRNYHLVHVGRSYVAPAVRPWARSGATLSLDLDEDDCEANRSIARLRASLKHTEHAAWAEAEAEAYGRLLAEIAPWFDRLWVASPVDQATLQARWPRLDPTVIPNAISEQPGKPSSNDGRTLLFVGSFGYFPNSEGITWFAREVWPALCRRVANLRLFVVGRDPPLEITALESLPGVTVTGPLEDLQAMYEQATLAIVPIRAGGGTRIKLLEALSYGVPVVSTSMGAAGVPVIEHGCGWIADGPKEFAAACAQTLLDRSERKRMGLRGRALIGRHYTRTAIVRDLASIFAAVTPKSPGKPGGNGASHGRERNLSAS